MKALVTCNLSDNTMTVGEEAWVPPVQTFGETLTLALRFERTVAGQTIEPILTVDSLIASLGFVDARPLSGDWALQIGPGAQTSGNTTEQMPYNVSAGDLQSAINAKTAVVTAYGAATVRAKDGSWWITFATAAAAVPMTIRDNSLFPLCFGQFGAVEINEEWLHEVRLIQLPADSTSTSASILPPAPTIERIQAGGSSGDYEWNEIQRLFVRPDFRATYYLSFGYARTEHLSVDDGPEQVLAALVAVLGENFSAVLAADNTIDITFIGDFEGAGQELLTVTAVEPPPGDLTFALPLNRAELRRWLRAAPTVTLPLEVKIVATEDAVETTLVPIRLNLTVQRPLNWAELEENPNVDWLRPPSPKNYQAFNPATVITGQQYFPEVIGDGVATVFAITHGLATEVVFVFVRENISGGAQLVAGTDYTVEITNTNSVEVTALGGAPTTDEWLVVVMSAQTVAAFAAGLEIEIDQVNGLEDRLLAAETAIEDLQTLVPSGTLVRPTTASTPTQIEIPDTYLVFPNARLPATFDPASLATATTASLAALPRPPGLLPAIRDTSATTFTSADLPGSPTTGNVYQNTGANPVLVPGGLGRRGRYLPVNEYAGWDGRVWYHVTRGSASSTSWFPTDFEQEILQEITFEQDTWRASQQFALEFDLAVALYRASSNAQWTLVIEHATLPSETDATVTAINLTTDGTGTNTALRDGVSLGAFTAVNATDVITLTAHGLADGDVIRVANSGGALPAGLLANADYVIRDATTNTFKLAALTTTPSLRNVTWQTTPLLTQRLIVSPLKQTRHFGCRIMRSAANAITAEVLKNNAWVAAESAPLTPRFAVRVRLIRFDTENSIPTATGYAFAALLNGKASIA